MLLFADSCFDYYLQYFQLELVTDRKDSSFPLLLKDHEKIWIFFKTRSSTKIEQ